MPFPIAINKLELLSEKHELIEILSKEAATVLEDLIRYTRLDKLFFLHSIFS